MSRRAVFARACLPALRAAPLPALPLATLLLGVLGACGDDDGAPPDATPPPDAARADARPDAPTPFRHTSLTTFEGPATCQGCHPTAVAEVLASTHYALGAALPPAYVYEPGGAAAPPAVSGFLWKLDGLPGAWAATDWLTVLRDDPATPHVDVPGGCGRCHVGIGLLPAVARGEAAPGSEEALVNVDCLVCHAATYERRWTVATSGGVPETDAEGRPVLLAVPRVDGVYDYSGLLGAAQSVGRTSAATCNRCHAEACGGGELIDGAMHDDKRGTAYAPETDGHPRHGLTCGRCHAGAAHEFKRRRSNDLWAYDLSAPEPGPSCVADCHRREIIHGSTVLEAHRDRIACTTCHASGKGGVVRRDFGTVLCPEGATCGAGGDDLYAFADERFPAGYRLSYRWFDGTVERPTRPRGEASDPGALIYPFKVATLRVPLDLAGARLPILGSVARREGDVDAALAAGAAAYERWRADFAGDPAAYGLPTAPGPLDRWEEVEVVYSVSHGLTREHALDCADCHSATEPVLDWAALGLVNPNPM